MSQKQLGAVLVFKPGTTIEKAKKALLKLDDADLLESLPNIETFDPRYGGPVFYVP